MDERIRGAEAQRPAARAWGHWRVSWVRDTRAAVTPRQDTHGGGRGHPAGAQLRRDVEAGHRDARIWGSLRTSSSRVLGAAEAAKGEGDPRRGWGSPPGGLAPSVSLWSPGTTETARTPGTCDHGPPGRLRAFPGRPGPRVPGGPRFVRAVSGGVHPLLPCTPGLPLWRVAPRGANLQQSGSSQGGCLCRERARSKPAGNQLINLKTTLRTEHYVLLVDYRLNGIYVTKPLSFLPP